MGAKRGYSGFDPGRVKTKSDLVVMLERRTNFCIFFARAMFSHSLDPKRALARSGRADYRSFSKASGTVRLCKLAAYSGIATEQET